MKWERCLNDQDWTPHNAQCSTCPPFHCFLYSALQQFLRLWTEPKRNCKIWWYIYHSITVGCKERLCSLSHSSKTKAFLTTSSSSSTSQPPSPSSAQIISSIVIGITITPSGVINVNIIDDISSIDWCKVPFDLSWQGSFFLEGCPPVESSTFTLICINLLFNRYVAMESLPQSIKFQDPPSPQSLFRACCQKNGSETRIRGSFRA